MKKTITLLVLLVAMTTSKLFAGGPSAPYRFDSTFAQNGFLIDTTTGGSVNSFIQYKEILVGANLDFWIGGQNLAVSHLAVKYGVNGNNLITETGAALATGEVQTDRKSVV